MNDDDRIAYLSGEDVTLPLDEREELDELRNLLGDPSSWAEPPADLEDRVAAAIGAEVTATRTPRSAAPVDEVPPAPSAARVPARHRGPWRIALAAAAIVLAAGVTVGLLGRRTVAGEHLSMTLAAPDGAARPATGDARLTRTTSGWRIELDAPGLPRLDGGRFYEAWLRNAAGVLVPIGTFNEGARVVLWAGVSPHDFPTMTVTEESADGNQASSGVRVLVGSVGAGG